MHRGPRSLHGKKVCLDLDPRNDSDHNREQEENQTSNWGPQGERETGPARSPPRLLHFKSFSKTLAALHAWLRYLQHCLVHIQGLKCNFHRAIVDVLQMVVHWFARGHLKETRPKTITNHSTAIGACFVDSRGRWRHV